MFCCQCPLNSKQNFKRLSLTSSSEDNILFLLKGCIQEVIHVVSNAVSIHVPQSSGFPR